MVKKIIALVVVLTMAISTSVVAQSVRPVYMGVCVNQAFYEALNEAFGTADPIAIGERAYTTFMTDFVNNRNASMQAMHAFFAVQMRLENPHWIASNILYSTNRNLLIQSLDAIIQPLNFTTCWHCGWSAPTNLSPGPWGRTGNYRTAGVWPNQFFENEKIRRVTVSAVCPNRTHCGLTLVSTHFYEFRWVRA